MTKFDRIFQGKFPPVNRQANGLNHAAAVFTPQHGIRQGARGHCRGRGLEAIVHAGARGHCRGRGLEAIVHAGARGHCRGRGLEAIVQAGGQRPL